jgi:2-hydroxy-3-oxopropionate reductase
VAARLLQHSFEVIGYDIRAEQLEALPLQGLRAAGSIAEAAANTDAVFPILPTLESVEEVVYGPGGLLETASRRTMIIQMNTISPELTRRLHTAAAGAGAEDLAVVITHLERLSGLTLGPH